MKKNNLYTAAPPEIAKAMEESIPVDNFLPPPEKLILKEDTTKVTLSLSRKSVHLFKVYAKEHGGKYQNMIRRLVDAYAERALVK